MARFDYVLVGGGLHNSLLALALRKFQPSARVVLLESGASLGGNHTWSFHESDVPHALADVVEPLVQASWATHRVVFPSATRQLRSRYSTFTSARLHSAVVDLARNHPNFDLRIDTRVTHVASRHVTTQSGLAFESPIVIDARGPGAYPKPKAAGYQKFVGLEFEVGNACVPDEPTLIDASVEQVDGFRFFYVLPLGARRVLIEDTVFSESAQLDSLMRKADIRRYADHLGLRIEREVREESGVLPLPTSRGSDRFSTEPFVAGYQGGWFHPTTGYSFPVVACLALEIARPAKASLSARLARLAALHERQSRYCMLLNRLMFEAFAPEQRWHVFERFYRLPEDTIQRFYALQLTRADKLRILCGRPPKGLQPKRLVNRHRTLKIEETAGEQS